MASYSWPPSNLFGSIVLNGSTSGSLTLTVPAVVTSYTLVFPAAQGSAGSTLTNDGAGNLSWTMAGGISIGALDSQAANAQGLALVASVLSTQSADATHPGMVNNTTQSFSGNKTFTGTIGASNFSGSSSGTNTGDVTIAAFGSTPAASGASLTGQALALQPADLTHPGSISTGAQTFGGQKSFVRGVSITGSADETQLFVMANATQTANIFDIWTSGFSPVLTFGPTYNLHIEGSMSVGGGKTMTAAAYYGDTAAHPTSGVFNLPNSETIAFRNIANSGDKSISLDSGDIFQFTAPINSSGNITGANLSGTNTGNVTLTAVGSTPSANAASLSGQALTLQPADGTNPGVITAGTQTIGGAKTFSGAISASNLSGTNTGDQTIASLSPLTTKGDVFGYSTVNDRIPVGSNGQVLTADSGQALGVKWATPNALVAPSVQSFVYTDGSAQTYTTPANVLYIRVFAVGAGAGGGGGGAGAGTGGSGTAATTFNTGSALISAGVGVGGVGAGNAGGAGGAGSLGTGPIGAVWHGSSGAGGNSPIATLGLDGGVGGNSYVGGAGASSVNGSAGQDAEANSGSGGQGGSGTGAAVATGGGGGSGATVDAIIVSPAASYTYVIGDGGAGGTAGTAGTAGGKGGSGSLVIWEYRQ